MKKILLSLSAILLFSFCQRNSPFDKNSASMIYLKGKVFDVQIDPSSFSLQIKSKDGKSAYASRTLDTLEIANLKTGKKTATWEYPEKDIRIMIELKDEYLDVDIISNNVNSFTWPVISEDAVAYTLPWHQGKYIPTRDPKWIEFWNYAGSLSGSQELAMQFIGVNYPDFALVFIIKNMFNNELLLSGERSLSLTFTHQFPATMPEKKYGFRIYLKKNDPVDIAKTYKAYIVSQGKFVSLEEKAALNPNIRKLYGAPYIYVWGNEFIVRENVHNWVQFMEKIRADQSTPNPSISRHILDLFSESESSKELRQFLNSYKGSEEPSLYIKNSFIRAFNEAMSSTKFYDRSLFDKIDLDPNAKTSITKEVAKLTQLELYQLNESLFYAAYSTFLDPIAEWGNGTSPFVLDKLKEMGIEKAWLGLESFQPAYMHPEFISDANERGYLIGTYDSYHSIHKPGKEQWETAKFQDTTLFNNATIKKIDGSYKTGFQGVGRLLNPTLSLPAVQNRVNDIFANGFKFNSWFIDCDATGEVFDDYTPGRMTSQQEDMNARLKRMAWIRDDKNLVIGSEGGNDFAAGTIAFGHGICTSVFVWRDLDWRTNKDSEYYFGPYYSPEGGVPIHFTKQVPVKDLYHYVYFDCRFNLPLYQLVYNNSVITTHHWGFGSLKFVDEVKNNKLREILYNFPPLYNLDRRWIVTYQNTISNHVNVWAKTHEVAVKREMTSFEWLTDDKMVQRTQFENALEIIANFGEKAYQYKSDLIPSMSLLIINKESDKKEIYTPIQ